MAIYLVAYTPHRWTDIGGKAICWWTRQPYSHTEIHIDGYCYSSSLRDGGVRKKFIDLSPPWWSMIPVPWRDPEDALKVYSQYAGMDYGWFDLIAQHIFKLPVSDPRPICSELCALMLGLPESTARNMAPGQLVEYVLMRNVK